jgi:uncharacterized protein
MQFSDKDFLEYVVKALVDTPDAVKVERKVDEMGVLLTLKVDPTNMGQIIGRNGNTAKAIRTLLRVVGIKNDARVNLKIEEPEGGRVDSPRVRTDREDRADHRGVDEVVDDLKL